MKDFENKMIIYRPHRGSLFDSLAEKRIFANVENMKDYILESKFAKWGNYPFSYDDIVISDESFEDERTGWKDTRYVCVKRYFNNVYDCPQCIGMCATDFPKRKTEEYDG